MSGALSFVAVDASGRFSVPDEARAFLLALGKQPISVAALIGPYRGGKSFLLHRMILCNGPKSGGGFSVGHTVNACTKGIHLSTQLVANPNDLSAKVLVIDTEGLGAPTATLTHDTHILVMTLLLSTVFMINTKGTIDQGALDTLKVVTNISNHLRMTAPTPASAFAGGAKRKKTDDAAANEEALAALTPAMIWIVRDFGLELVDQHGKPITSDEYLEQSLQHTGGDPDKDETRRVLRTMFRRRACVTMCRPVASDEQLRALNSLPESDFDLRFVAQCKRLRELIHMYAKPTAMDGSATMTGAVLVALADKFCAAFNDKRVPVIRDVWDSISKEQCQHALSEAVATFKTRMAAEAGDVQTRAKLEALLASCFESAAQRFNELATGNDKTAAFNELRAQLNKESAEHRKAHTAKMADCAVAILQTVDAASNIESLEQLMGLVAAKHAEFTNKHGRDPDTQGAWNQECVSRQLGWANTLFGGVLSGATRAEQRCQALERELAQVKEELGSLRADASETAAARTTCEQELVLLRPLAERTHQLEAENASLCAVVEELRGAQQQAEDLQGTVCDTIAQLEMVKEERAQLQVQSAKQEERCMRLTKENESLLQRFGEEIDSLRASMETTLGELKRGKDALAQRLAADTQKLQQQLADAGKEAESGKAALAAAMQKHKSEQQAAQRAHEQKQQDIAAQFEQQLKALKAESTEARQKLHGEKSVAESRLHAANSEIVALRSQLSEKLAELSAAKSELRGGQSSQHALQAKLASSEARLDAKEKLAGDLQRSVSALENRLVTAEEELRQVHQRHSLAVMRLNLEFEQKLSQRA